VLRYGEDLSEASVAGVLGCPAGTVQAHACRGLRTLRERLGSELPVRGVNETRASQRDGG
jgi:DNA-directed RNA polymerase specialized sigma24 family protein